MGEKRERQLSGTDASLRRRGDRLGDSSNKQEEEGQGQGQVWGKQ